MERDNMIDEIKEKDLIQLQKIQQRVFNSTATYDKIQTFYQESKEN